MPPLITFGNPPTTLTRRVQEIRYRHAKDGKWYKHTFGRGVAARLNRNGSVTLQHESGKALWDDYPTGEGDQSFLKNPRGKAMPKKRRKLAGAALAAHRKKVGKRTRKAKARQGTRRRVRRAKRRTQVSGGVTMARRRRRRATLRRLRSGRKRRPRAAVTHRNPPRRRRRHAVARRRYRRNPGGSGVLAVLKQGVKDGALVLAGQGAQNQVANIAARFVPVTGLAGAVISQIGGAVVVGIAARKFVGPHARMLTAGAFSRAMKGLIASVSPTAAGLLGDTYDYPSAYADDLSEVAGQIGAWPGAQMGAYPGGGLGDGAADEHVVYS